VTDAYDNASAESGDKDKGVNSNTSESGRVVPDQQGEDALRSGRSELKDLVEKRERKSL